MWRSIEMRLQEAKKLRLAYKWSSKIMKNKVDDTLC